MFVDVAGVKREEGVDLDVLLAGRMTACKEYLATLDTDSLARCSKVLHQKVSFCTKSNVRSLPVGPKSVLQTLVASGLSLGIDVSTLKTPVASLYGVAFRSTNNGVDLNLHRFLHRMMAWRCGGVSSRSPWRRCLVWKKP